MPDPMPPEPTAGPPPPLPPPSVPSPPVHRPNGLELFLGFGKIAVCGFGGVLAWARRVVVQERAGMSAEAITEQLALSQVLPGPHLVKFAIMFGARSAGVFGALAALMGLIGPPTILMIVAGTLYRPLRTSSGAHRRAHLPRRRSGRTADRDLGADDRHHGEAWSAAGAYRRGARLRRSRRDAAGRCLLGHRPSWCRSASRSRGGSGDERRGRRPRLCLAARQLLPCMLVHRGRWPPTAALPEMHRQTVEIHQWRRRSHLQRFLQPSRRRRPVPMWSSSRCSAITSPESRAL